MTANYNAQRVRPLLQQAAQSPVFSSRPQATVVIRDTAEEDRLRAELTALSERMARRIRLEDATICAGYRRYESGPETPVLTLVGRTSRAPVGTARRPWWKLW